MLRILFTAVTLALTIVAATAALPATFLKTNGYLIKDNAGAGQTVCLRGFNLGGWLEQEGWMCPTVMTNPTNPSATIGAGEVDIQNILASRFGTVVKNQLVSAYRSAWIASPDLDYIAAHGMNTLRVPFTYLNFIETTGTWRADADAFAELDWIVSQAWARGIYVILDLHAAQGGQDTATFWNTRSYQDDAVRIWQKVALRYAGNPAVAGYDLLNEPTGSYGSPQWDFMNRCYQAIRAIDPDHMIIIEATWHIQDLPATATYGWSNVCYEYHWYNWNSSDDQLLAGVDSDIKTLTDNMTTGSAGGKVTPSYIGEFSEWDAPQAWRRAVSRYSQYGFAWTPWTYKGNNIGAWALYNIGIMPANVSTDSAQSIMAQWRACATADITSQANTYLRDLLACPVSGTIAFATNGTLAISATTLLTAATSLGAAANLAITQFTQPSHGVVSAAGDRLLYRPSPGYSGQDAFTFVPFDQENGQPALNPAVVSISVPVTSATVTPYACPDQYLTHLNSMLHVPAPGVLENDGDLLARPLSAELVAPADGGSVTLDGSGGFIFTPSAGYTGAAHFAYRVHAGGSVSSSATATILVASPAPTGQAGLTGAYYSTTDWTGTSSSRIDSTINFSWNASTDTGFALPGSFSAYWQGWVTAPFSGTYTITEFSDDAIGVYVSGSAIVQDWSAHASRAASGTVRLAAGQPAFLQIYYINYGGPGAARLYWQHPLIQYQIIPAACLTTGSPALESSADTYVAIPSSTAPVAVVQDGSTAPSLSGSAVPGATVEVVISGSNSIMTQTLTADETGLWSLNTIPLPAGSYTTVFSYRTDSVISPFSAPRSFTAGLTPPAVTAVSATGQDKSIFLSWAPSSGANGYTILRSGSTAGPFITLASYTSEFSYTDSALPDRTAEYYRIVPVDFQPAATFTGPASAIFSGTTYSALDRWRLVNFGSTTGSGSAADTFAPAGDGIPNLLKFALNLPPFKPGIFSATVRRLGANIHFTYLRSDVSVKDGTAYTVEWTDTLSPTEWSSANVVQSILTDDSTTQQVDAIVPSSGMRQRFIRLRVEH